MKSSPAGFKEEVRELLAKTKAYLRFLDSAGVRSVPWRKSESPHPAEEVSSASPSKREALLALSQVVIPCTKCEELVRNRRQVVFGTGNARAKVVFVGEAPGEVEDERGLPFVGRAGELLTKIIESIGLKREEVFITNVLKCRPPGNRNPLPEEVLNCEPYLMKQLEIIQPKIICALGNVAAQALLKSGKPISELRGKLHSYRGIPVLPTFHPAFLLRNPNYKKLVWQDMKFLKRELDRS